MPPLPMLCLTRPHFLRRELAEIPESHPCPLSSRQIVVGAAADALLDQAALAEPPQRLDIPTLHPPRVDQLFVKNALDDA